MAAVALTRSIIPLLVLIMLPARGITQTAASPPKPASLEGMVVKQPGGDPVRKAVVRLSHDESNDHYDCLTDSTGHFTVPKMQPGHYRMVVEREGFVSMAFGENSGRLSLAFIPGQHLKGLVIKLLAAGIITGRVLDAEGDPVANSRVMALMYIHLRGGRRLATGDEDITNDLGEYRLRRLGPGKYYLLASAPDQLALPSGSTKIKNTEQLIYVATYYPASRTPEQAVPLDVTAGGELSADFGLVTAPAVQVSGTLALHGGSVPQGVEVFLKPDGAPSWQTFQAEVENGSFNIKTVAGEYTLFAFAYGEPEMSAVAKQHITVDSGGLRDLRVELFGPTKIVGRVHAIGEGPSPPLDQFEVLLDPVSDVRAGEMIRMDGIQTGKVKKDGTFELDQTMPGTYNVILVPQNGDLQDWYVTSVKSGGGQDVTDTGIEIKAGAPALQVGIEIKGDAASVSGAIADDQNKKAAQATVVAVPGDRQRRDLYQSAVSDQNGNFELRGLAPGEYRIYAWKEILPEAWLDPDFLQQYEGVALKVSSGQDAAMQLVLSKTSKSQP